MARETRREAPLFLGHQRTRGIKEICFAPEGGHERRVFQVGLHQFLDGAVDLDPAQRCKGTLQVWAEPFTRLRLPKLFNLRTDPYEFADVTSNTYYEWFIRRDYIIFAMNVIASKFAETFEEFRPIQKPNSFTIDDAIAKLKEASAGG